MNRRGFLKIAAGVGSALACPVAHAQQPTEEKEFVGVLVDTTRCIGCRKCELACARANGLEEPDVINDGALERERLTDETRWTVVNRYETEKGAVFVKKQCMHCSRPACTAACLTKAMYKTREGPVIWRESKSSNTTNGIRASRSAPCARGASKRERSPPAWSPARRMR